MPVGGDAGGIPMAQWHGISRRKPSGGRKVQARGKRATEISTEKQFALVGEPKRKIYRKTGGNTMVRVMAANQVSINNPKTGKRPWVPSTAWSRTHPTPTTFVETSSSRAPSLRRTKVVSASRPVPVKTASSTVFSSSELERRLEEASSPAHEARPWTTTPTDFAFGRATST